MTLGWWYVLLNEWEGVFKIIAVVVVTLLVEVHGKNGPTIAGGIVVRELV